MHITPKIVKISQSQKVVEMLKNFKSILKNTDLTLLDNTYLRGPNKIKNWEIITNELKKFDKKSHLIFYDREPFLEVLIRLNGVQCQLSIYDPEKSSTKHTLQCAVGEEIDILSQDDEFFECKPLLPMITDYLEEECTAFSFNAKRQAVITFLQNTLEEFVKTVDLVLEPCESSEPLNNSKENSNE